MLLVVLGVNTEETKCVDRAGQQLGGQHDNIKVADKFLEACDKRSTIWERLKRITTARKTSSIGDYVRRMRAD